MQLKFCTSGEKVFADEGIIVESAPQFIVVTEARAFHTPEPLQRFRLHHTGRLPE